MVGDRTPVGRRGLFVRRLRLGPRSAGLLLTLTEFDPAFATYQRLPSGVPVTQSGWWPTFDSPSIFTSGSE